MTEPATGATDSAGMRLLGLVDTEDPYDVDDAEILPLQIQAAHEAFARMRPLIPLLDRRATEAGIEKITSLADVVPLLFSHTVHKSYPQSFIQKGRWDRLLEWYDSLAAQPLVDAVDLTDVENIDDFAAALTRAGMLPHVTSGTSGKISLINNTPGDRDRAERIGAAVVGWPRPLRTKGSMHFYGLVPSSGYSKHVEFTRSLAETFAPEGKRHFLSDEPMLPSVAARAAAMRTRMMDGSATPAEIAAFDDEANARADRMSRNLRDLTSDIIEHRAEPMIVMGVWTQHWAIMQQARELGCADGEFHPDTVVYTAGGLKGASLPADYREQIYRFYGDTRRFMAYGMTEIDPSAPQCEVGRYHRPPWVMWLVLDQAGETLAQPNADGIIDGRFAVLSFNHEGRWAGLITGDHIHLDTGVCPCGRRGPTILDDIVRYSEQDGGDDKIGCAGSMEAYLRGRVGE
ncbi:unannotated protein [freshwater metagenome]|uniref:Unannotated protein n=1 Tax=freshwater metagenome TaxID=449393 RepID=A0A6J7C625_9ZZZZ|nr:hypothetical protein [Actinomycetota bacterium]